jgi:hypothetical protein
MLNIPNEKTEPNEILIERSHHYCKIRNFTKQLGCMFIANSELLLQSKYLYVDKKV